MKSRSLNCMGETCTSTKARPIRSVGRYATYIITLMVVTSCAHTGKEEHTSIVDLKEEQLLKEIQSTGSRIAIEGSVQEQAAKYDTVPIGDQIWMSNNLDVSHFRNGDEIPYAATEEEWEKAARSQSPAWCYYDNDEANGKKYGKLYNWYAVNDARQLAPIGWRIPTKKDWEQLGRHIGKGNYTGGYALYADRLSSVDWDQGSNKTGFTALPTGGRFQGGEYLGVNDYAYFWSLDSDKIKYDEHDRAYVLVLMSFAELSGINSFPKEYGLSVRCIK